MLGQPLENVPTSVSLDGAENVMTSLSEKNTTGLPLKNGVPSPLQPKPKAEQTNWIPLASLVSEVVLRFQQMIWWMETRALLEGQLASHGREIGYP